MMVVVMVVVNRCRMGRMALHATLLLLLLMEMPYMRMRKMMMMVDVIQHVFAASKKWMALVHISSDHIRACSPYFRAAGRQIRHRAGLLGHFAVSRVSI